MEMGKKRHETLPVGGDGSEGSEDDSMKTASV